MILVIEGIDGSGKGTQTAMLGRRLEAEGMSASVLSFPRYGQTTFSRTISSYLNGRFGGPDEVSPYFSALLYAGDRFESRDYLLELEQASDLLILDRYVASNVAYNAAKLPIQDRDEYVRWLTEIEFGVYGLPHPKLTLLLDVPVAAAASLVGKKGERMYTDRTHDIHESDVSYLAECRQVYLDLAHRNFEGTWEIIPAAAGNGSLLSPELIADAIYARVRLLME